MNEKIKFTIFITVLFTSGILIMGFLDGFWDAFGVFLMMWSNNCSYKKESISEKFPNNQT